MIEFKECEACSAKRGMSALCKGCLHNRKAIENMRRALEPFSDFAESRRRAPPGLVIAVGISAAKRQLTMADFYRARDALEGKTVRSDREVAAEKGRY